jgi:hypothetical protein
MNDGSHRGDATTGGSAEAADAFPWARRAAYSLHKFRAGDELQLSLDLGARTLALTRLPRRGGAAPAGDDDDADDDGAEDAPRRADDNILALAKLE